MTGLAPPHLEQPGARIIEFRSPNLDASHSAESNIVALPDRPTLILAEKPIYEGIKRAIDIVGALVIGAVFLALLPLLAIIIRLDSHGSIFYKQTRVGKDEQLFTMWKLRSMRNDAEKDGAKWASANDDRVTRVGSVMRKTRLDELPQVLNVLHGEMSLVGPRPERPEFVEILEAEIPNYALRHHVKPGVTGWAQVKYRYTGTIEETRQKLQFDLDYIANRSLAMDTRVLLLTILVILRRNGW